jgi:CheY-like chemotaxis protein
MAYILIVDTQAEFRQQLVRLLEQAGHRAVAVATISEAGGICRRALRTSWRRMLYLPMARAPASLSRHQNWARRPL